MEHDKNDSTWEIDRDIPIWTFSKNALEQHDNGVRADERANVIDEIETKLYEYGFIWTEHAEKVWEDIREQLKSIK